MDEYVLALLKFKGIGTTKVLNYILKYKINIIEIRNNILELINKEDLIMLDKYIEKSKKEIEINKDSGIGIISILNNNYPLKLISIKDPVLFLYYKGNLELLNNVSIAIIGSREINKNQEILTRNIAKNISSKGITIVSGLAIGTDTNAHIGSYQEKGKTIAVLPSGLDKIFPNSNAKLAKNIVANNGLLVSEYSIGVKPNKYTFVKRDRIQAALSNAVMVIKASENGGTMNAVKVAQNSNKFVAQYKENINRLILNSFDNKEEDINNIINIAQKQTYKSLEQNIIKQEKLF